MTPLETGLIGITTGIGGWVVRSVLSGKAFVKQDICRLIHKNLDESLARIEKKLDDINGACACGQKGSLPHIKK